MTIGGNEIAFFFEILLSKDIPDTMHFFLSTPSGESGKFPYNPEFFQINRKSLILATDDPNFLENLQKNYKVYWQVGMLLD